MIIKIQGEQPFQVLSTSFSISASESGYDLYFSADGYSYSKLFTVGANTNRQVTQVAAGSYYFLSGNTDTVTVNWIANCYSGGDGGGGSYVLPIASSDTLGGIKVGSGMTITEDGVLSANPGGYTLPAATDSTLGGVKVGSGLTIDANGVLSVSGGTGGDMTVLKSVSELPNSADTGDVVAAAIKVGTDWVYVGEGYYDTNISSGNPYGAKYVVLGTYADIGNNTVYFGIVWENGQWKFVYDISVPDYGEYVSVLAENSDSVTIETYTGSFDIYFSENDGVYTFDVNNDSEDVTRVAEVVTNPMVLQFNGTSWDKVGDYTLPAASQNTLGGVKVGSGLTIDSGGTLSVSGKQDTLTAGNGIDISGTTVSVKAGEGLGFSGDTLVVSGGTGGGIEKVTELPANPEEGDMVQLFVSGKTVQTVAMEMSVSEKNYEVGYQVAVISGSSFECEGYGTLYGKWVHNGDFDINLRNRRSADYRYFDFEVDAADIELGSDADSLTETVIPGYYQLWEFSQGEWKQIDREIVFDPEFDGSAADFYWRVYSGVNFIDTDYITIRYKVEGNNKREFKPYDFKYYGMDCQASDGRGAEDGKWGQIGVESVRVNESGINAAVQKEYTANANNVPSVVFASFGNDGRGGLTYDAGNDQFLYDSGTIATGDTSNYAEDLIDYNYLNGLFSRTGLYANAFVMNSHVLNVESNGETLYYSQPVLSKKPITNYTIGEKTFKYEITFKYSDYVLKMDVPEENAAANLRITQA